MTENSDLNIEKKHLINSVIIPIIITVLMFLCFIFEKGMGLDFHKAGVFPRHIDNIWSIFTVVFIHNDWGHLLNNMLSFFILSTSLYYFYTPIATKILLLSYIFCGLLLWIIGRESWHIGASGLIYTLAFFLFISGVIRKHIPLIAISLIVVFIYGSIIWYIFPWEYEKPISWEGHLSGAVTGIILAFVFRKKGPQKPVKIWEDEDEDDENDNNEMNEIWKMDDNITDAP